MLCYSFLLTFTIVRPTEVKLPGNFYKLPIEIHDSMLIMARSMRVEKARRDFHRLKEQRAEKRRKDEIALQERIEKASADHVETLFLYEQYVQGECYKTVEEVERGLAAISSQTGKVKELKKHITIYVKGLR